MSDFGGIFSSNNRDLSIGSSGGDVSDLQNALNNRPPTSLALLDPDGVFGQKTDARVREFQRYNNLSVDGIVGPITRAALIGDNPDTNYLGCDCCQPEDIPMSRSVEFTNFLKSRNANSGPLFGFTGSAAVSGAASAGSSGPLRMLTDAQVAVARSVYGESLDFSSIFISNKTGIGGRPFTMAFPDSSGTVQIMNMGSYSPSRNKLIHELGHVWQSQHHSDKYRFMINSVSSMKAALKASSLAVITDPMVSLNKDFPAFFPFDAYAYDPSTPFANLAAEQMAQAIENGESAIVGHVKVVTKNMLDSSLIAALSQPGYGDHRVPGVK
jgi:hypothetical protein